MEQKITVGDVKKLLADGKKVFVKTINNEFTRITNFIEKGNLKTFQFVLENGNCIKVSSEHKFYTSAGWIMAKDVQQSLHTLLCDDGRYWKITSIENIGIHRIVDITVEHPEHCYFGNGILNHNSGKSLVAAHVMAECQKKGGIAVLYDIEGAVGMLDFYQSLGLNTDKLLYIDKIRTLEEVYSSMESIIGKSIANNKDIPLVIVLDSVTGATTMKELEEDYEKKGYATEKAKINSGAMRRIPTLINGRKILIILIQQLRANMDAIGFGADKFTTINGVAIPYTASVRLRFKKMGQIKGKINGLETSIGERIQVQIIKNRVGPPRRKVVFDIRYESGIDNYGSWLTTLKDLGALSQSGSSYGYKYIDETTGEEVTKKFQSKDFKKLLQETPGLKEMIYQQICDAYIMKYDTGEEEEIGIDDVTLDTGSEIED